MGVFSDMGTRAPSKRVGATAIIVCALIVAVIVSRNTSSNPTGNILVTADDLRPETTEVDTDGDGLKDWEENLWGFSPTNPDTDGDGIGDREEAENERRLVAETPAQLLAQYETATTLTPPSSTALAGQILLSQLFASKQAGLPVPEASIELAGEVALDGINTERTYTTYTIADITTTSSTNTASVRAYGNAVAQALMAPTGQTTPHELFVILSYVQTNDAETFKQQMDIVLANYARTLTGLRAVQTPTNLSALHINLMNAMSRVYKDLTDIRNIETSPIVATIALEAYKKNSTTMAQLFEYLRNELRTAGITYTEIEPGYALTQTNN